MHYHLSSVYNTGSRHLPMVTIQSYVNYAFTNLLIIGSSIVIEDIDGPRDEEVGNQSSSGSHTISSSDAFSTSI